MSNIPEMISFLRLKGIEKHIWTRKLGNITLNIHKT